MTTATTSSRDDADRVRVISEDMRRMLERAWKQLEQREKENDDDE